MKEVVITIDDHGKTTIATRGFHGRECQSATADLERALGVKSADTPTPEMFLSATLGQSQSQRA